MTKLNKHDMPAFAMWMQAIVICVIIFAVSLVVRPRNSFI